MSRDKLARRVRLLEDRQRREMTALRNEVFSLVALALSMPEIEVLTPRQVIERLDEVLTPRQERHDGREPCPPGHPNVWHLHPVGRDA